MLTGWVFRMARAASLLACAIPQVLAQTSSPVPAASGASRGQGLLAEAAAAVGVQRCAEAAKRLSPLASQGTKAHDLLIDWDRLQRRDGPVFALVGAELGATTIAISVAAFPEADGSCTFMAERISSAPYTCASIAQSELPGHRGTALLKSFNVYVDPNDPGASVTLLDAPPVCLIIRRHVQFRWKPKS